MGGSIDQLSLRGLLPAGNRGRRSGSNARSALEFDCSIERYPLAAEFRMEKFHVSANGMEPIYRDKPPPSDGVWGGLLGDGGRTPVLTRQPKAPAGEGTRSLLLGGNEEATAASLLPERATFFTPPVRVRKDNGKSSVRACPVFPCVGARLRNGPSVDCTKGNARRLPA